MIVFITPTRPLKEDPEDTMSEVSEVAQSCVTLCHPMDYIAHQSLLPMEFSRQEYWGWLQFPSPGDLPNSGIKPMSLVSHELADGFFTTCATWETHIIKW